MFNNYNMNSEYSAAICSSKNKKNALKNIIITDEISNKYQYRNKYLNKNNEQNLSSTLEIYKDNTEIINNNNMNKIDNNNKINYKENIDKICKRIFKQNTKRYANYINNNKKVSYDNKSKEKKRIEENFKNKIIYTNYQHSNKNLVNKNKIKKEFLFPSTYRINKVNKSINNINQLSNKIIVKNILSRNINSNLIQKKSNQTQTQTTIESNINELKKLIIHNQIFSNNFLNKNCTESFQEKNNKITKKINILKNKSQKDNSQKNNININTVSSMNKKYKINRNIKEILSLKANIKKNKVKIKSKSNKQSEKDNTPIDSSSRNNFNKSNYNYNYLPITSRDKPLFVSRNPNYEFNNFSKSNTELIVKNKKLQKNHASSDRKNTKNNKATTFLKINLNKINNKKQKIKEKFLSVNTEMSLNQIYTKLNEFCKRNNLECKNDGKNYFKVFDKNLQNSFGVEIIDSSNMNQLNIVKFFHRKNTGEKMKEMITKLFIEIFNYE